jgi:hypothetical protein
VTTVVPAEGVILERARALRAIPPDGLSRESYVKLETAQIRTAWDAAIGKQAAGNGAAIALLFQISAANSSLPASMWSR